MKSKTRKSAWSAWKLQLSLLPYGVVTFVITLVGIVLGLSLAIVGIGIPILAGTLAWNAERTEREKWRWEAWREGRAVPEAHAIVQQPQQDEAAGERRASWGTWFRTLAKPEGYRAAANSLLGFPLRIALFVVTLTVPLSVAAILLAPAVYKVSDYLYGYILYNDATMEMLLPPLSPFERSLVIAGVGFVLMLFVPSLLRACGRIYAGWLDFIAGRATVAPAAATPVPAASPVAAADDWLARAEAAISRFDEDARHTQTPQPH